MADNTVVQRGITANASSTRGQPLTMKLTDVTVVGGTSADLTSYVGVVYDTKDNPVAALAPTVTEPGGGVLAQWSWTAAQTARFTSGYRFAITASLFGVPGFEIVVGQLRFDAPGNGGTSTTQSVSGTIYIGSFSVSGTVNIGGSASGGGSMTAAEILTALKTVDGAGSGLDADLLDGLSSAAFELAGTAYSKAASDARYDSLGAAAAAQAASQPLDADLTALAAAGNSATLAAVTAAFTSALLTKLNGIEAGATADMTAAEILAALLTVDGAGSGLDADTLDGISSAGFDTAGAAAAAQAASQPLDSDLTAIAALTTTAYGRAFLTLANQAALMALLSAATSTAQGIVELATDAEAITGTDTARATTPANVKAVADLKLSLLAGGAAVENLGAVESNVNTVAATGSTETLDTSVYGVHDCTMDQNCTFTFSNPAPSGKLSSFVLILRGAFTPTLPAAVKWSGGAAPTYTTPAMYTFTTVDAGTTWLGAQVGKAFA